MKALPELYALERLKEMTGEHLGVSLGGEVVIYNDYWLFEDGYIYVGFNTKKHDSSYSYAEEAEIIKEFDDCTFLKILYCTGGDGIGVFLRDKEIK